jgi:hypothetical protein
MVDELPPTDPIDLDALGANFDSDPSRYCKLALAALKPLTWPTEAMVDAAHQAVWFDGFWAINSRVDFRRQCGR